jgi:poly-gamma-glutamate synthesis protein (capsule biosynthesis protein)
MRWPDRDFKTAPAGLAFIVFWLGALLAGCAPAAVVHSSTSRTPAGRITATPFLPIKPTATASVTPAPSQTPGDVLRSRSPTPTAKPGIWIADYIPGELRAGLDPPPGFDWSQAREDALVRLEVGGERPVGQWVFALAAPFPSLIDGVRSQDILRSWKGEADGPFAGQPLLMESRTAEIFSALWGAPAPGAVEALSSQELLGFAWEHRPSWAIVPFEDLEPRWKTLEVDGISPLRKGFDAQRYPLAVTFSVEGDPQVADAFRALSFEETILANRQPQKLTNLLMTGVTALVRATAFTMERNGIAYPAQDIGEVLSSADLTHVSNEIPFDPDCPPPNPSQADLRFCSDPAYIALMEEIGTDIVELTGDHFADRGPEAMRYTLDLYNEEGWVYYGGGVDRSDAQQARVIEHNGNRLAFIGCNGKGGGYATAGENQPGAVACDFDWMHQEIGRLQGEGMLVIATFQHFEYYSYYPQPLQIQDFGGMAKAGAVIVSGSQSHQPQGMGFEGNTFMHYGLGNLFFDQYHFCTDNACDDAFIDRHVFYDGRYIGTELLTIRFVDYARPRWMAEEERVELLDKVFRASGW